MYHLFHNLAIPQPYVNMFYQQSLLWLNKKGIMTIPFFANPYRYQALRSTKVKMS